jgi:hypothetical protein
VSCGEGRKALGWEPAELWETSGSGHTGALLPFSVRGPAEAGGVLSGARRQVPSPTAASSNPTKVAMMKAAEHLAGAD